MVRAADCRSAGPWFESGCALKARLLHAFIILMCEGGLITVMKAWADCRHRLPMVKPMTSVLKAHGPRCTKAITWVHSSVVRAADCRSAGPWFKSGCALVHNPIVFYDGKADRVRAERFELPTF